MEDVRKSEGESVVECGETCDHAEHGRVKINGIWKGVRRVDAARNTDDTGVIIVRYSTDRNERSVGVDEY